MNLLKKNCENCGKDFLVEYRMRNQKYCCKKCSDEKKSIKKEFTLFCLKCKKEFTIYTTEHKINIGKHKKYCSNECSNSRIWTKEHKDKLSEICKNSDKVKIANKKLNKNKIKKLPRITKCLYCNKDIFDYSYNKNRKYHADCWLKISGGIRKGSSRGKCGWYKGYWCDSSYELAYLIYCLDHNINIERNTKGYEYYINNKKHIYYPDFRVEGKLMEIKNYRSELTNVKLKCVDEDIDILYRDTIKPYLEYVKKNYGKKFIELYNEKYVDVGELV